MSKKDQYNSILVAFEYQNPFENVFKSIDKDDSSTLKKDFQARIRNFNNYGVKLLETTNVDINHTQIDGEVNITPNRVQYKLGNFNLNKEKGKVVEIINHIDSIYKEEINPNPDLEFKGCVLEKIYSLDKSDTSKIKQLDLGKGDLNKKEVKLRVNFHDENKLNYNVDFIRKKEEGNEIFVKFDLNSRHMKDGKKDDYTIEDIIEKITEYTENRDKLFELI